MTKLPKISQAEMDVMSVLWENHPLGASDVFDRLAADKDWNSRTVKTLLSRLVDKGALSTTKEGRRFLYSPLVSENAVKSRAAKSLVNRLFGGRAAPLVAQLADSDGLSQDDIAELEALLKELKS